MGSSMWRSLLSLVLALLVTMVLAVATAYGVLGFMRLSNVLPQPPMWLVFAPMLTGVGAMLYARFKKRKLTPPAASGPHSEAPE
jgi:hypothetical protein